MKMLLALFVCLTIGTSGSPISQFDEARLEEALNIPENEQLEVDETGQCIYVKSEEGVYSFISPGTGEQVCGLYLITDPDKTIEFEFQSFDISCSKGGLLSAIDGWELNGQFFPSPEDHPLPAEKRFAEFCGKSKPRKAFRTSQNVGVLEFRVPTKGQGFSVAVRFHSNPKPCNAVIQDYEGTYTLRNYNRRSNCSISVIYPLSIQILATSIGVQNGWPRQTLDYETGLLSKCRKRGIHDFVEIRGGDGLDPSLMKVAADFCGLKSLPSMLYLHDRNNVSDSTRHPFFFVFKKLARQQPVTIACGNTAVRLVSSGHFENSVTFSFNVLADESSPDLVCPAYFADL